jgi:hypothetical protein
MEQSFFAAGLKEKSQLEAGRASAELGEKTGARTERERDYIRAVAALYKDLEDTPQRSRLIAYCDATKAVVAKYPKDHDARNLLRSGDRGFRRSCGQNIRGTSESRRRPRQTVCGGAEPAVPTIYLFTGV